MHKKISFRYIGKIFISIMDNLAIWKLHNILVWKLQNLHLCKSMQMWLWNHVNMVIKSLNLPNTFNILVIQIENKVTLIPGQFLYCKYNQNNYILSCFHSNMKRFWRGIIIQKRLFMEPKVVPLNTFIRMFWMYN